MPSSVPPPLIDFQDKGFNAPRVAGRGSWRALPMPDQITELGGKLWLEERTARQLRVGHIPVSMDDRWFVFCEGDRVFVHRSWTGICIFEATLRRTRDGAELCDARVNRDPEQYASRDDAGDWALLALVVETYFGQLEGGSK